MARSSAVQEPNATVTHMKTRTLTVLLIVVAIIAAGTLVLRGEGGRSVADWFISLHGGARGGH
jgi:hypothetical protein